MMTEVSATYRLARRHFLASSASSLGTLALASLLDPGFATASAGASEISKTDARAKRVIYLFQSGGPPQQDFFDYKPHLERVPGQETPASVFNGQRLTGMTAGQSSF